MLLLNQSRKNRRTPVLLARAAPIVVAALALCVGLPAWAQEPYQFERDLTAKHRLFREVGAGFRQVRRGPNGNYYILTAPAPAVVIYDSTGKQVGQVPSQTAAAAKGAALVYGESFDVDADGRVVVCDRGANSVKIYSAAGELTTTIPMQVPVSVVFLPGNEIAVASPASDHLVTAYDLSGKMIRDYGDREEMDGRADVKTQMNYGKLVSDEMGNNYFYFDYLPEPTVRKFDRVGYLSLEITLKTLEFAPAAQAARKAITRSEEGERTIPSLHRIISAVGVDPKTQELWIAIGTLLMWFDKDGQRLYSFRTYLPNGARLDPTEILVEPSRLVIAADPQGIYEFSKPEKIPQ
jgi:hypothetical protein